MDYKSIFKKLHKATKSIQCRILCKSMKNKEWAIIKITEHMSLTKLRKLYYALKTTITKGSGSFLFSGGKRQRACVKDYWRMKQKRQFNLKHKINNMKRTKQKILQDELYREDTRRRVMSIYYLHKIQRDIFTRLWREAPWSLFVLYY